MAQDLYNLNRQLGEVIVKIDSMMEKIEDHKEMHKEDRKEIKEILKLHNDRISVIEHYKTKAAVIVAIIAAGLSYVGNVLAQIVVK